MSRVKPKLKPDPAPASVQCLEPDGIQSYFEETRRLSTGFLLLLPLLVLYQMSISNVDSPIRNTAEVWITNPSSWAGPVLVQVLNVSLILFFAVSMCRPTDHSVSSFWALIGMVFESAVYGLFLLKAMGLATQFMLQRTCMLLSIRSALTTTGMGVGAAVYEELVFRLALVGGPVALLVWGLRWDKTALAIGAVIVSSAAFAAAHHIGPLGDPWEPYTFAYRALCGLLLGFIYVTRGLGVAVGTHACYNLMVLFGMP